MLDPKLIRNDLQSIADQLKKRNFELDVAVMEDLESKRKACQVETENLQNVSNIAGIIGRRIRHGRFKKN